MNFPDGVEYLSAEKFVDGNSFGVNTMVFIFGVICIITFFATLIGFSIAEESGDLAYVSLAICLACLAMGIIFYFINPVYHTQYLVKVNEDVKYSELIEDYSVADQQDNITVLRPLVPVDWEETE